MQKVATGRVKPWARIPVMSASNEAALKNVRVPDNHFIARCGEASVRRLGRLSNELGNAARKQFIKDPGVKVELGWVLVRPNGHWLRVIGVVKLGFDFLDFIFLDEEKVAVELVRHVVMLVVTNLGKVTQHPGQGIGAGANKVTYELVVSRVGLRQP